MTDETQEQQITAVGNEMSASFLAAKKRSDATLAAIEQNPGKFTMLTATVRPDVCISAIILVRFVSASPCRIAA